VDYRGRNVSTQNKKLSEFILQLANGKFLIPTFQRLFVWSAEDITRLWDSIYQRYPIGSILCWKTKTRLHVHRHLGGFLIPGNGNPVNEMQSYILDGQQRATSLLVSFHGGTGQVREQYSFDYTLYFNLVTAAFFFEKDYFRHRRETESEFLIRLKDVSGLPEDYCSRLAASRDFSPVVEKNLEQLRYIFTDYSIPLINLEGFDNAGVCAIYERINQTGMRLKNMDILIARGFKNYDTVVEEDFPVTPE
jgi:uncharacterized protein with ParB-like and HNH nuclease domain